VKKQTLLGVLSSLTCRSIIPFIPCVSGDIKPALYEDWMACMLRPQC